MQSKILNARIVCAGNPSHCKRLRVFLELYLEKFNSLVHLQTLRMFLKFTVSVLHFSFISINALHYAMFFHCKYFETLPLPLVNSMTSLLLVSILRNSNYQTPGHLVPLISVHLVQHQANDLDYP